MNQLRPTGKRLTKRHGKARQPLAMPTRNGTTLSFALLILGLAAVGKCDNSNWNTGMRLLLKLYDGCQNRDFIACLKVKAINFFDRMERNEEIALDDHMSIVRNGPPPVTNLSDRWARNMAEGFAAGNESRLNDLLLRKVADFFNGHKIVVNLPKIRPEDIQQEVAEGRGKMKKMMSMMMMGLAMKKAAAIPMALGILFLLAGKALIMSKLALVLTLITALKKLKSSSK